MMTQEEQEKLTVERILSEFDELIGNVIRHYGFKSVDDVNDLKQKIYLAWIEGGYTDVYDPSITTPKNFLTSFVGKRMRGERTRRGRDILRKAIPISSVGSEDEPGTLSVEALDASTETAEIRLLTRENEESLKRILKDRSQKGYGGKVKDLVQVYELTKQGLNQKQIAEKIGYSLGSTNAMVKQVKEILDLFMENPKAVGLTSKVHRRYQESTQK